MKPTPRVFALTLAAALGISPAAYTQTPTGSSSRGAVAWTVAGAGGGFGIGLWVGLTKFDDSIHSDRKVWTTAIVGAAVGGVSGYFAGRSRAPRRSPASPAKALPLLPAPRVEWPRNIGVGRNIVASRHGVS